MKLLILIFGILKFTASFDIYNDLEYRLPNVYNIYQYQVNLKFTEDVLVGPANAYEGSVRILFEFTKFVDDIKLHAPFNITEATLKTTYSPFNDVDNITFDSSTGILTITSISKLSKNWNYTLTLNFNGQINAKDIKGLYRSSYKDAAGVKRFLLTTQFEPIYARTAFPCFDEPEYKANFILNLTYPKGYNAYSNTLQDTLQKVDDDYVNVIFKETPNMPTYLVAFVISNYSCSEGEKIDRENPFRICSRTGTDSDREVALNYGPIVMEVLGNLTGIKYKDHFVGKLDDIAVPDLSVGAMENYGIVTHRESSLLWNNEESSNANRRRVITNLVHEYTHMWFGDLVTLNWWDNTFLKEGFARYFEYFATARIPDLEATENWEIAKQFVVLQQQNILYTDGFMTSLSLTSKSETPSEVTSKFSSISYSKGACIFRMLNNFIGPENFLKGINKYLTSYAHSVAGPSDLWNAFDNGASLNNQLPSGKSLGDVMDNWINRAGYPVVTVSSRNEDIILTQKRFLYGGEDETLWYVPVSYTTSDNIEEFTNVSQKLWLSPTDSQVEIKNVTQNDGWIILNNQGSSYYRVNYDSKLWKKIKTILLYNHEIIDELNRAQIVDDIFNLAKAAEIKYKTALNLIAYLKNETEYYPFYAAFNGFNKLVNLFGRNSDVGSNLTKMQLSLIENVLASVPITELNDTNYIYTMKLVMVQEQACMLEMQECIDFVQNAFNILQSGKSINNNLKHLVYCNALKYSENSKEDWNYLWQKFEATSIATEQEVIVSALGCTREPSVLKNYLNQAINMSSGIRVQDIQAIWNSVVSSNPKNADIAFDYFKQNHEQIFEYAGSYFLNTIVSGFSTEEQARKLEGFLQSNLTDPLKTDVEIALKALKENLSWVASFKKQFEDYFNGNDADDDDDNDSTTDSITTSTSDDKETSPHYTNPTTEDPNGFALRPVGVISNIILLVIFIICITD